MRVVRTLISIVLFTLGVALALAGVLDTVDETGVRILMVLCGMLLVEVGAWQRANPFLPSERRNRPLRDEVEGLIGLIRMLEASTRRARSMDTPEHWAECQQLQDRLQDSVERMKELVGGSDRRRGVDRQAAL